MLDSLFVMVYCSVIGQSDFFQFPVSQLVQLASLLLTPLLWPLPLHLVLICWRCLMASDAATAEKRRHC